MKVGQLAGPGRLVLEDRPPPTAGPGEVVVELAACGVCGTDLEKLRGNYRTAGRIGHEPAGVVVEVGAGVQGIRAGERVAVHHHVPCLTCPVCRRGDLTFCPSYSATNIDPGGFAERFRVPAENVARGAVHHLRDEVSWNVAALLEPAACALTALRHVGFAPGDSVVVLGLGPVGLLYAAIARAQGAGWIGGAELSAKRRDAARGFGVDATFDPLAPDAVRAGVRAATGEVGVDLAVVATGAPQAVALACDLPRRGGTVNLFGLPGAGSRLDTDLQRLYLRGVRVVPTYATTEREIDDVHELVAGGRLDLRSLVSHSFPIAKIEDAFAQAGRADEALKVVVTGPAFR